MPDERKPESDEVTEKQLEAVAGGATASTAHQDVTLAKQADKATPKLAEHLVTGDPLGVIDLDLVETTDEDDD